MHIYTSNLLHYYNNPPHQIQFTESLKNTNLQAQQLHNSQKYNNHPSKRGNTRKARTLAYESSKYTAKSLNSWNSK